MRLSENFVQEVLDRTDMEELVGRYVTLKRSGSNTLIGLCPFHSERTPSFSVSPDKKLFFCFGCHAGGTAITFVQKAENLDFTDAVEFLADRAGLAMPRENDSRREEGVPRNRILNANLEAAKYFRACLFDPAVGGPGMEYFREKRGLTEATIRHFGLGYAPASFGGLTDYLHGKGFTDEELQVAFLCGKSAKTGRSYDYFRNRVMFPIIDPGGRIVAFGGRVLDDSKPKYLNTSDTPAFLKSNHLFALNFAKNCCGERMILCEGYMDVIALHAAGFEFAVATLGTAITPNHARLFSRYTKRVIISYDSDEAGQNAAKKAMKILGDVGMEVRILKMDGAKDPDEFIRKFGPERFRRLIDESQTGFEYRMAGILAKYDLQDSQQKIRASGELCEVIADYPSQVEREVYLADIAKRLELPTEVLRNNVGHLRDRRRTAAREQQSRDAQASVRKFGDRINPDSAKDLKASSAEENVLGLLLLFEEYRREVAAGRIALTADDFVTGFHKRVFEAVMRMQNSPQGYLPAMLGEEFSPDEIGRIRGMEVARQELTQNGPEVFRTLVAVLKDVSEQSRNRGDDLRSRLDYLRERNAKIHKGKDQDT